MNIVNQLLALDLSLLEWSRTLVSPEYARLVQFSGELVVIYVAVSLIGLWLYGVYKGDNQYKRISLAIFITIVSVFVLYAVINIALPKWRPGATEMAVAIAPLIPHPIDNSFPSGHALFSGSLFVALFRYYRVNWIIILALILAVITLAARMIGGVHYLGDILAGLVFGVFGAVCMRPLIDKIVITISPTIIQIAHWIRL